MPYTSRTRDFHFDLPDNWIDRTMIAFSAPQAPGQTVAPNILIAYDTPRNGESLGGFANRQLQELMSKAKQFQLEFRHDSIVRGRPAVEMAFEWEAGPTRLKQRQIHSFLPDGRAITLVFTAAAAEFAQAEPYFAAMQDSFEWNEEASPAGA